MKLVYDIIYFRNKTIIYPNHAVSGTQQTRRVHVASAQAYLRRSSNKKLRQHLRMYVKRCIRRNVKRHYWTHRHRGHWWWNIWHGVHSWKESLKPEGAVDHWGLRPWQVHTQRTVVHGMILRSTKIPVRSMEEQRKSTRKRRAAERNHYTLLQPPVLPVTSLKQLGEIDCKVRPKEWLLRLGRCKKRCLA